MDETAGVLLSGDIGIKYVTAIFPLAYFIFEIVMF